MKSRKVTIQSRSSSLSQKSNDLYQQKTREDEIVTNNFDSIIFEKSENSFR
jgi:hypothetical protein